MHSAGKRLIIALLAVAVAFACAGCGEKTLKIANVDEAANTFDLVDSSSGRKIEYDRLTVNGKDVVDWLCTGIMSSQAVVFATEEGQIIRDGSKTTFNGQGYTTAARLSYELKDGVLNITGSK